MALTAEQQADLDYHIATEEARAQITNAQRVKEHRLETLRIAQAIVLENARNSTSPDPITAADLIAISEELVTSIQQ